MNITTADDTDKLIHLSVKPFTETLMKQHYPMLFLQLNKIEWQISNLKPEIDIALLIAVHVKMNEELDELYRKEKVVLFPFLLQLEEAHKMSDSCKPFKNVKYHFTYLVSTTQQLKTLLNQAIREKERKADLEKIKVTTLEFEKNLINIQQCKEQYLFKKFRNCSGSCKTL